MASFTDTIMGFNPYVQQIPTDDYVRVGLIKQQQYDQGVQRVQGYIDSVAGLEVIKPEQKNYLQQRVNQLRNQVTKVVSEDFSNQQLLTSVGTLTSQIASDPIIKNAVSSTQAYKAGLAKMKKAQDDGKSSPSNEWVFQNQASQWLSDGDISSSFSAEYIPHTDVNKKILDVIKELHPNSQLEDIPYKRDGAGNILTDGHGLPQIDFAMLQRQVKGLSPERISAAIQSVLTPQDTRQLYIDGMYNYRAYDKAGMKSISDAAYNNKLSQINDAIKGLLVERQTNTNDQEHISSVDRKIQSLRDAAERYQNRYKQEISNLDKGDLDGFKASQYMENYLSRFSEGFAYAENSLTYKENPFFMAAERRRENDIKFQEYLMNKQFESAKLALEEQKFQFERDKFSDEMKLKIKKAGGAGGEGDFLDLAGTQIRAPIEQEDLERVNVSSFIGDTEKMQSDIDTQKMALLAQLRPDLIHVQRDANGLSPRYEYDVVGKDPNTVKNEATATLLKYKDSYDKGEGVPDGVKTYFDNLGSIQQKLDNRKAGINKLQTDADRAHSIPNLLKTIPNINISSNVGTVTVTPEDMINFRNKLSQVFTSSRTGGGLEGINIPDLDDKKAAQVFPSAKEKVLYESYKKYYYQKPMNSTEQQFVNTLRNNIDRVIPQIGKALDERNKYLNNAVREMVNVTQPTEFPIVGFKSEDRNRVQANIINLFNDIVSAGKGNESPNFKESDISEMLSKKNADNTSYSLVAKGNDRYAIRLSNTTVTDKPREINITKAQAQDFFGAGKFLDDFQAIREALQISKSTGKWTTDVQGEGKESAFKLNNGLLNNYSVKYHVEDPLKTGGLQVKLYIYDKADKEWKERNLNAGFLMNETQVTKLLSGINDSVINEILQKKP
jgi:hypothetical protein